jgi:hypothetical protein
VSRLHIVNGDSTLQTLPLADVGGEAHSWFDFLSEGPAPDGSEAGWSRRASALADRFGLDASVHHASALEWQQRLAAAATYDEVVLWFEGDLFCLFNLAYLLDWFAGHPRPAVFSLVCPADDRLGTLPPEQLLALFRDRCPLSQADLVGGSHAWCLLSLGSGKQVAVHERGSQAANEGLAALLQRAVRLQAEREPSGQDGISGVERHLLLLLGSESRQLGVLFRAFNESELGFQFGWGDMQFVELLVGMRRRGLLRIDREPGPPPWQDFGSWLVAAA